MDRVVEMNDTELQQRRTINFIISLASESLHPFQWHEFTLSSPIHSSSKMKFDKIIALIVISISNACAFAPINPTSTRLQHNHAIQTGTQYTKDSALKMAEDGKKKRRRRKKDTSTTSSPEKSEAASGEDLPTIDELKSLANFSPPVKKKKMSLNDAVPSTNLSPVGGDGFLETQDKSLVALPDIRDALKLKEMKKVEEEEKEARARPKISKKDKKAYLQVSFGQDVDFNLRRGTPCFRGRVGRCCHYDTIASYSRLFSNCISTLSDVVKHE